MFRGHLTQFLIRINGGKEFSKISSELRILILLHKPSQDTLQKVYTFVPTQKWTSQWTDDKLYTGYGLTKGEIVFIESMVRPMEVDRE